MAALILAELDLCMYVCMYVYLCIFIYLILHFQKQRHSHIIKWSAAGNPNKQLHCNTPGCIKNVLKRHRDFQNFQKLHEENKQNELMIKMQSRAISNHLPCFLVRDNPLIVTYIELGNDRPEDSSQADDVVLFHVNIRKGPGMVRNPELENVVAELTVYAYKGETVREALQRDSRFHDSVFNGHELLRLDTGATVTLSAHVDDLNDVSLMIQSSSQPDNQSG